MTFGSPGRQCGICRGPEPALRAGRKQQARRARHHGESLKQQQWAAHESSPFFNSSSHRVPPSPEAERFLHVTSGAARQPLAGASTPVRGNFVPASLAPATSHLRLSLSVTSGRAPGRTSGLRGKKPKERGEEEGLRRLGPNQQVPWLSLLLTRSGEGRGGASRGRRRTSGASSWRGGAEERGSSATSARGCGGERRKSGPILTATDSETPPPPSPRK